MIRFEDSRVEVKRAAKDVVRTLSTSLLVTPAVFRFVCPGRYFCGASVDDCIRTFSGVVQLHVDIRGYGGGEVEISLVPLCGLSPTLKSLHLACGSPVRPILRNLGLLFLPPSKISCCFPWKINLEFSQRARVGFDRHPPLHLVSTFKKCPLPALMGPPVALTRFSSGGRSGDQPAQKSLACA